jgi:hypothetical protein
MGRICPPKSKFSPGEDSLLTQAVSAHGTCDWSAVAACVPGRNARQCRERWTNYVNPDLTNEVWTDADDRLLLEKYRELGSKWYAIAGFFSGRGKNSIRNRFLALRRRKCRERGAGNGRAELALPKPATPVRKEAAEVAQAPKAEPAPQDPFAFLEEGDPGFSLWHQEWESDLPYF